MIRLSASLALPGGPLELELGAGDAVLLDGPDAGDAVDALLGIGARRRPRHRISVDGRRVDRRSTAARARRGLAGVTGAPVAADVTVRDHLAATATAATADRLLADAPLLAGRGHDPAGFLSGGERRVLAWLRLVALDPRVVVLGRAGTGLDDDTLRWAGRQVARWRDDGVAVVVRPGRAQEHVWAADGPGHRTDDPPADETSPPATR